MGWQVAHELAQTAPLEVSSQLFIDVLSFINHLLSNEIRWIVSSQKNKIDYITFIIIYLYKCIYVYISVSHVDII